MNNKDNDFYQTESADFKRVVGGKDEIVKARFFYVHHGHKLEHINEKLEKMGLEPAGESDFSEFFKQHEMSLLSSPFFQYSWITTTNPEAIKKVEDMINLIEKPTDTLRDLKIRMANDEIKALPAILRNGSIKPIVGIKIISNDYFYDHDGTLIMAI